MDKQILNTVQTKLPVIFTDIDGVFIKGKEIIPGAVEGLKILRQPLSKIDPKSFRDLNNIELPFYILSNGSGMLEKQKAQEINQKLKIQENSELAFKPKNVVLSLATLRQTMKEYHNKMVLIDGLKDIKDIGDVAQSGDLNIFMTFVEFGILYPYIYPWKKLGDNKQEILERVAKRCGLTQQQLEQPPRIHALFILHYPSEWDLSLQITIDFASSQQGELPKNYNQPPKGNNIPIYSISNDDLQPYEYECPRLTMGAFNQSVKAIYKQLYNNQEIQNFSIFGKPSKTMYEYAEQYVKLQCEYTIGNCYIIGDNPKSDIAGGIQAGWKTILVRTGLFCGKNNDPDYPADYVVNNFYEAIQLIFQLENLPFNYQL